MVPGVGIKHCVCCGFQWRCRNQCDRVRMQEFTVRSVRQDDLESIAEIESVCFPAAEAASRASFKERIAAFPESFLVAEVGGRLVGYINGCATDSPVIFDELFYSTSHHNKTGENLTVFGLAVIPEFRKQGIASQLMQPLRASRLYGCLPNVIVRKAA